MQEEHIRTTMNVKNLLKSASTDISEDSIQQMVEAAQESTRLAQENLKPLLLKKERYRDILNTASKKPQEKDVPIPKLQELSVEIRQTIKASVNNN
jgi:predicted Zn-dependent protease